MGKPSKEGFQKLGAGLTEAQLLRLNKYALEQGLIDKKTYESMMIRIKSEATIERMLNGETA